LADPMMHLMPPADSPSTKSIVRMAVFCEAGLGALAIALGWLLAEPPLARLHWSIDGVAWGLAASLPMVSLLLLITHWPGRLFAGMRATAKELIVPLFRSCSAAEMGLIAALAGIGEELLFRGVIQPRLADWLGSGAPAILITSILFGLAHLITPMYAVLAGLIGMYLGCLMELTGSLLPPIVAHGFYDFVALVYLTRHWRPGVAEKLT